MYTPAVEMDRPRVPFTHPIVERAIYERARAVALQSVGKKGELLRFPAPSVQSSAKSFFVDGKVRE